MKKILKINIFSIEKQENSEKMEKTEISQKSEKNSKIQAKKLKVSDFEFKE